MSMAISVPASPFGEAYFNVTEGAFPDDSRSIGLYSSFGEDVESNASFGSWPDPYSCSCEVSSSFPSVDSSPFTSLLNSPTTTTATALPSEDDLNIITGASPSELLEHFGCCHPNTPVLMHSDSVDTPKQDMLSPDEMFVAEENQYAPHLDSPGGDSFEGGIHEAELPGDSFPFSYDDDYVEEEEPSDEAVDPVHIPPPLNMKRIEMYDNAYYESIEAAEVPLDVIENKRPFQCGLAGCNKTFKNPQTMKMHHKTHFSDGTAVEDALPTLTAPGSGSGSGNGSPASWMAGRSKKIPSRCPKCRKTFVGLYELRRHYGRKHSEGERPFQCRKCDKRFYIEVDVRDHEKLCGEQVECKCGLKFAFKCNMVAHKKAHPACRAAALQATTITTTTAATAAAAAAAAAPAPLTTNPSTNSTSVTIMNSGSNTSSITNSSGYQSTLSDEDSSRSRWISRGVSSGGLARDPGRKRCHELVEQSRPDLMAKFTTRVYSRRTSHSLAQAPPTPDVDFAALCDAGGTDTALWSPSNLHYSVLPWSTPPLFGALDQFQPRGAVAGKLSALDLLQLAGLTPGL